MRRIPIFPTLIVLAAVAVMIGLGFWQLERTAQKEALLTKYRAAQGNPEALIWDGNPDRTEGALYRRALIMCVGFAPLAPVSGRNSKGQSGWALAANCDTGFGYNTRIITGWSKDPNAYDRISYDDPNIPGNGAVIKGVIAPGPRLVADPPLAGLEANARPDPNDIPNNHLSYAVQWFLFALTALVIYALALRKRISA
jgi:surfeit locus 1 family protein